MIPDPDDAAAAAATDVLKENDALLRVVVREAKRAGRNTKNSVLALVDARDLLGRTLIKQSTARAIPPPGSDSFLVALALDAAKTPNLTAGEVPGPLPDHEPGVWRIYVEFGGRAGWAKTLDFDNDARLN